MVLQLLDSGLGLLAFLAPRLVAWVLGVGLLSGGGGDGDRRGRL